MKSFIDGKTFIQTADEAKREEGRAQVREAARLVQGAAAAKRVWVSTVRRTTCSRCHWVSCLAVTTLFNLNAETTVRAMPCNVPCQNGHRKS